MIGETVSHYRIVEKLGGGGMGVVYEAEDLNLGRRVALKFLPDARETPEALERFKREARAASALNHPHICVVYDLGEHEGKPFLAMERMQGQTLKEALTAGPMPVERVVALGSQMADALEAAHGAGIVHRDLKPANVFVTERGDVKLLDFGLAKLTGSERQLLGSEVETAAQERNLTSPGMTMGTVSYMSPEQARGMEVDQRSDLFSLGVLLYEMSTGRPPFPGNTAAEIFHALLSEMPTPPSSMNQSVPPMLEEIILKCLEQDRDLRYQHASEVRADFRRLARDGARASGSARAVASPSAAAPSERRMGQRWALALFAAAIAAVIFVLLRSSGDVPGARSPAVDVLLTQLTTDPGVETQPSLSPDGKMVAYVARTTGHSHVYLLRVGGKNPIDLTKDSNDDNSEPAFSPDGERIAFRSERDGGGESSSWGRRASP